MFTMMIIIAMKTTRTVETAEMLNGQPGCCHKEERLPDVRVGGGGDIHNGGDDDDNGDGAMMMVVVIMMMAL